MSPPWLLHPPMVMSPYNDLQISIEHYKAKDAPPSSDGLYQHTLRATHQAGHIWSQSLVPVTVIPSPAEWGWKKDGYIWSPVWITKEPISRKLPQLCSCNCTKQENGVKFCSACKCVNYGHNCSSAEANTYRHYPNLRNEH